MVMITSCPWSAPQLSLPFVLYCPHMFVHTLAAVQFATDFHTISLSSSMGSNQVTCRLAGLVAQHKNCQKFDKHFNYRQVIGKLNYLETSTRPDIAFAAHQCARFCADTRQPHADAFKWLGCYLSATKDKYMILDLKIIPLSCLCRCQLCWKLELQWSQQRKLHCKVKTWIHHHVCRMSDHLGITTAGQNCFKFYRREWAYWSFHGSLNHHHNDRIGEGTQCKGIQHVFNQANCTWQSLWRQQ